MVDRPRLARRADYRLLFLPLVLSMLGIMMVHSASVNVALDQYGVASYFTKKQLIAFVIGFVGLLIAQSIDFTWFKQRAGWFWAFTIGILILVLIFPNANIRSWISLGSFTFQPGEIAKLSFILFFAAWLDKRRGQLKLPSSFLAFMVIIGILGTLSMMEPDFGTLVILVLIAFGMYWVAGMNWRHLLVFVLSIGLAGSFFIIRAPYRLARLTTFMNPSSDSQGTGYHLTNMFISVGSGSWWGLGLGNSKQKRFFLPEPHTDSIFAVTTEELGFVRAAILLVLLFYYMYLILHLAGRVEDGYARFVLVGLGTWIFIQTLFNVGPTIGLIPLTGVPLPFISYGGTSLITLLTAAGIVLNISKYAKR